MKSMQLKGVKGVVAALMAVAASVGLAACGNSSASDNKVIQFWDPYPQYTAGSDWDNFVKKCAPEGYSIKRTGMPQNNAMSQLTTTVKTDSAPDIVLLDNPFMPSAVNAGLIQDVAKAGVKVSGFDSNLEGPGIVGGTQYGLGFGSNALGLYYNPAVLKRAGVDPASIKNWASLNDAISKVVASGSKGITFAGITGAEGVFQYLPWFWGAGGKSAEPTSQAATDANNLLANWIHQGWAPKSATTDNQSASWDLMLTGQYGFGENGSWDAAAAKAKGFEMLPIPGKDGGVAPVPTGGEFMTLPVHKNENADHLKASVAVINCLTNDENLAKTNETIGYLAAKSSVRQVQVAANELWKPWVGIVENAKGRTTEVGLKWDDISATLSKNLQAAMNS